MDTDLFGNVSQRNTMQAISGKQVFCGVQDLLDAVRTLLCLAAAWSLGFGIRHRAVLSFRIDRAIHIRQPLAHMPAISYRS